jgi:hypothetical protein
VLSRLSSAYHSRRTSFPARLELSEVALADHVVLVEHSGQFAYLIRLYVQRALNRID